jgi:hypothetical protein
VYVSGKVRAEIATDATMALFAASFAHPYGLAFRDVKESLV